MTISQAIARTPWRVRLVFSALPGGAALASSYTLVRGDSAFTSVKVAAAWTVDAVSVELALSEALLPSLVYTVTIGSDSSDIVYYPPVASIVIAEETSSPEDEAYGIDLDWFSSTLDPNGDLQTTRGMQALREDLVSVVQINPGEIAHRPDVGAGLQLRVNGPNLAAQLASIRGAVKREWLRDDRVEDALIKATASTDGTVELDCSVKTVAIDESLKVIVNG